MVSEEALTVYTAYFGDKHWHKLARVLRLSVEENCPNTRFVWAELSWPKPRPLLAGHAVRNLAKQRAWNAVVQEAETPLVLMDTDTMVLGDLRPAFRLRSGQMPWDIGLTKRPGAHLINGGVVFVRPTDSARAWFAKLTELMGALLDDPEACSRGVEDWGGAQQAAMADMLDKHNGRGIVHLLPCAVWNSTRQTWKEFGPETRVVHVNSRLRRLCFAGRPPISPSMVDLAELVTIWLSYARRAR